MEFTECGRSCSGEDLKVIHFRRRHRPAGYTRQMCRWGEQREGCISEYLAVQVQAALKK